MTRNIRKVLGQTAQLANNICGKQNLLHSFPVVGTTKSSSTNNNYSTKAKKENFINIPKQLNNNNNKLMNILVHDFKNYSSSSVNSNSNNNNTIQVLNPVQYEEWSQDEVCSLLSTPKVNGGAGLTIEDVKPLYDAGFKGTSLANIVTNIQEEGKKEAREQLQRQFTDAGIVLTVQLAGTLQTVVNWVDNLLKTRLYHLWSPENVQEQLCNPNNVFGLSKTQVKPFIEAGFDGVALHHLVKQLHDNISNDSNEKSVDILTRYGITFSQVESACELINSHISQLKLKYNAVFKEEKPYVVDHFDVIDIEIDEVDKKHLPKSTDYFSKEELLFLGKISNLPLKSLLQAKNADQFVFDLKNREKSINMIKDGIKTYYHNYTTKKTLNKQQIPFILAEGGSGSGKSRMLIELPNIFRHSEVDDVFKRTRIIYYNFTNGFSLDSSERDKHYLSMLIARIIYSAFDLSNNPNLLHSIVIPSQNYKILYEIFYIISKKLHEQENIDMSIPIPIVIALDEFQKVTRTFDNLGTNIQHLLSWYIRTLQKQHGLILMPALGGTLTHSDITFLPTDHANSKIELYLPCLREEDTASIIEKYPTIRRYYTDRSKLIWDIIGCVPRHLEWAIEAFETLSNKDMPIETLMSTIYTLVATRVMKGYSEDKHYLNEFALVCLSGLPITRDQKPLEYFSDDFYTKVISFEKKGLLYEKDEKLQLPLIVMDQLEQNSTNRMLQNFVTISKKPEWEKLEEFVLQTLVCRFNVLFFKRKVTSAKFTDLFYGAIFPSSLNPVCVTVESSDGFTYSELSTSLSKTKSSDEQFYKTKKQQEGVDGLGCNMILNFKKKKKQAVILSQTKLQEEDTVDSILSPLQIAEIYSKALNIKTLNRCEKYVFLVTNKRTSLQTQTMIINGMLEFTEDSKQMQLPCPKLILVDRECFPKFFNAFLAQFLTTFKIKKI